MCDLGQITSSPGASFQHLQTKGRPKSPPAASGPLYPRRLDACSRHCAKPPGGRGAGARQCRISKVRGCAQEGGGDRGAAPRGRRTHGRAPSPSAGRRPRGPRGYVRSRAAGAGRGGYRPSAAAQPPATKTPPARPRLVSAAAAAVAAAGAQPRGMERRRG